MIDSMNDFLINKIKLKYENSDEIFKYLTNKSISSFRINRIKTSVDKVNVYLNTNNINFFNANFFSDCYIIDVNDENLLKSSTLYKEGNIYFQSLSSMLPPLLYDFSIGENILDMCASPGGKCLLIQSIMQNKINLTATELHYDRYNKLLHNINISNANIFVKNINALDLDDMLKFDFILLDVPCTGTGTLDYYVDLNKEYLDKIIYRQQKLINKAYKLLKNGGVMIYSTCSILEEENEMQENFATKKVGFKKNNFVLKGEISKILEYDNIAINENQIKILPSDIFEGFYIARFIK